MRHRVAHRKLGRVSEHRLALLRSQASALLEHEHLETTLPKAKELRPFVERLITTAKRGLAAGNTEGRELHARRLVLRDVVDQGVVAKLFDTIAPRFAERPGGYTRILKLGYRRGDSAAMAQIELVGSEWAPKKAEAEGGEKAAPKSKGVGGRLRAAAKRIRGEKTGKAEKAEKASKAKDAEAKPEKGAKVKGKAKGPKAKAAKKGGSKKGD
jgi:large subunit ribosomal protein L17